MADDKEFARTNFWKQFDRVAIRGLSGFGDFLNSVLTFFKDPEAFRIQQGNFGENEPVYDEPWIEKPAEEGVISKTEIADEVAQAEVVLGHDYRAADLKELMTVNNANIAENERIRARNEEKIKIAEEKLRKAEEERKAALKRSQQEAETDRNDSEDTNKSLDSRLLEYTPISAPAGWGKPTLNVKVKRIQDAKQERAQYIDFVKETAKSLGLDPTLALNQFFQESTMNPLAEGYEVQSERNKNGKKEFAPARAYGPYQFRVFNDEKSDKDIQKYYARYGIQEFEDLFNPEKAIPAALRKMADLTNKNGSQVKALCAYHAGQGFLNRMAREIGKDPRNLSDNELLSHLRIKLSNNPSNRQISGILDYIDNIVNYNIFNKPFSLKTSNYGWRGTRPHHGHDYSVPGNTKLTAPAQGQVVFIGNNPDGYGNYVVLDHGNGVKSLYGHLNKVMTKIGNTIQKGQVFALTGNTGAVRGRTGNHLHWEISIRGINIDPSEVVTKDKNVHNPATQLELIKDAKAKLGRKARSTIEGNVPAEYRPGGSKSIYRRAGTIGDAPEIQTPDTNIPGPSKILPKQTEDAIGLVPQVSPEFGKRAMETHIAMNEPSEYDFNKLSKQKQIEAENIYITKPVADPRDNTSGPGQTNKQSMVN